MRVDYENVCEKLMRECRKVEDEKFIAEAYELLKGLSEDELMDKCDLCIGEAIRAKSVIWLCGEYLKSAGEDKKSYREDLIKAANDFFDY